MNLSGPVRTNTIKVLLLVMVAIAVISTPFALVGSDFAAALAVGAVAVLVGFGLVYLASLTSRWSERAARIVNGAGFALLMVMILAPVVPSLPAPGELSGTSLIFWYAALGFLAGVVGAAGHSMRPPPTDRKKIGWFPPRRHAPSYLRLKRNASPGLRFSATLGLEPEVWSSRYAFVSCSWDYVQGFSPHTVHQKGKIRAYYRCYTRYNSGLGDCTNTRSVRATEFEEAVWEAVYSIVSDPERLRHQWEEHVERERRKQRENPDAEARVLADWLRKLEHRRSGYLDLAGERRRRGHDPPERRLPGESLPAGHLRGSARRGVGAEPGRALPVEGAAGLSRARGAQGDQGGCNSGQVSPENRRASAICRPEGKPAEPSSATDTGTRRIVATRV